MRILFLCTHNACRSVLCESVTRKLAGARIDAGSAGSQPSGRIHPLTLPALAARDYPTVGLHSKGLDDMQVFNPDVVITVCDSAARDDCPLWLGDAVRAHWGLLDPSMVAGDDDMRAGAFEAVINLIEYRVRALLELPFETYSRERLATVLNSIAGS
jgi:arsenate reductase